MPYEALKETSAPEAKPMGRHGFDEGGLLLIAAFKFLKAVILLGVGFGALKLLHKDVAAEVERWADLLRLGMDNTYVQRALTKISLLSDRKIKEITIGTFCYSGLLFTEGVGLSLRKHWAEYITLISTAVLLPLEIYELTKRTTFPRVTILLLNIAIVIYLAVRLKHGRLSAQQDDR